MSGVMIYQRAGRDFSPGVHARGHHVVYRAGEINRCPGCGRAQWMIGRMMAECGFCATAVPLAEAQWSGGGRRRRRRSADLDVGGDLSDAELRTRIASGDKEIDWAEKRRHERVAAEGRTLQLLIDGSPLSFAVRNISAGGLMGDDPVGLEPLSTVQVRFEGGILVPAKVRWTDGPLTGLAFSAPVLLDLSRRD